MDVQLLRSEPQIQEVLLTTTSALTGMLLIASPLILQSCCENGVPAVGTTKRHIIAKWIGPDFIAVAIHHEEVRYFHLFNKLTPDAAP